MSQLDTAVNDQIEQACPSLTADEAFALADKIETVLAAGDSWTPSRVARKVGTQTHKAGQVLDWMVSQGYAQCDNRGSWTHYFA